MCGPTIANILVALVNMKQSDYIVKQWYLSGTVSLYDQFLNRSHYDRWTLTTHLYIRIYLYAGTYIYIIYLWRHILGYTVAHSKYETTNKKAGKHANMGRWNQSDIPLFPQLGTCKNAKGWVVLWESIHRHTPARTCETTQGNSFGSSGTMYVPSGHPCVCWNCTSLNVKTPFIHDFESLASLFSNLVFREAWPPHTGKT